jgi:hypothetical protein
LLYAIKLLRIKRGMENLDIGDMMQLYKRVQAGRLAHLLEEHPELGQSQDRDICKIDQALLFNCLLKTVKAVILVSSCSYFFAMGFKMLLDIQADLNGWDAYAEGEVLDCAA